MPLRPEPQPEERAERLPAGRHGLDPAFVRAHQRRRLLDAMVSVTGADGCEGATVQRVAKLARVTNRTVYELFPLGRDGVMLAAYERGCDRLVAAAASGGRDGEGFGGVVAGGLGGALGMLAESPAQSRLMLMEAPRLGVRAHHIGAALTSRLSAMLATAARRHGVEAPLTSALLDTGVVGGLHHIVHDRVRGGRLGELPDLVDELTAIVLLRYGLGTIGAAPD